MLPDFDVVYSAHIARYGASGRWLQLHQAHCAGMGSGISHERALLAHYREDPGNVDIVASRVLRHQR